MPGGRPPKPVEEKRRLGNLGKRTLPDPVDTLPQTDEPPAPPIKLSKMGAAFWHDLWTVGRSWLNPQIDGVLTLQAVQQFEDCQRLRRQIAQHGTLLEEPIATPSGQVIGTRLVPNPAERLLRAVEKELRATLVALAIPPTERARLGLLQIKVKESVLDALAQRRGSRTVGELPSAHPDAGSG